jgi:CPA2 family monovalent cation:H+ antiporter-2
MTAWPLLTEIVYLLAACLLGGAVFARLKQSPIAGYLLAGMLVGGPGSLQIVQSQAHIEAIAELGVALLLFGLGLEFSVAKLRQLGRAVMVGGALQVVATLGAVALITLALGGNGPTALTIGAMLALSSTAVVLRTLVARGEVDSRKGRTTVAVLLVQDVALVPLAVLVTSLGEGGGPGAILLRVAETLGLSLVLMAVLYVAITHGVMRFLRRLGAERNREFSVLLAVVIGLGATALAHGVGLSPALGAFLAGMFLGSSALSLQLRADVASLRIVLLTLFFGAVGMVADPVWILEHLGLVLAVSLVVILVKILVAWGALRVIGRSAQDALAAAFCLAQVGEFAFVLGAIGLAHGTLSESDYGLVVSVSIVSLLATPYLIALAPAAARWIGRLLDRGAVVPEEDAAPAVDIVLVGFGPAGREALRALDHDGLSVCVIELNEASLKDATRAGYHCVLGDATQEEILAHAGVHTARVIVITPPSPDLCLTVLHVVRAMAPRAKYVVRARHARSVALLERAGANYVASDEFEVGRRLRAQVRRALAGEEAVVDA